MADLKFISDFLSQVEGTRQTVGYIPCNLRSGKGTANYRGQGDPTRYAAMGASGVTIATGCDLGQTNSETLFAYGLNGAIVSKFQFYLGKKKDTALRALHERPLTISMEEAEATDLAVHTGYLRRYVIPAWTRANPRVSFDSLPREAQAVFMSVCFQKGCGGVRRDWPKLWAALTSCNWRAASRELKTGFAQYVGRRHTEGALLETLLA